MKSKEVKSFLDGFSGDIKDYLFQDLDRWVEVLKCKKEDPFEFFYSTRQEFRSLIRYRAMIAQKKFSCANILGGIIKIHGGSSNVWVTNLFLSCSDIGPGLYIEHGFSTIVFAKSIGKNFYINQNVTIGTGRGGNPTIGDNVRVGANSVIIGNIFVADDVKVGAGAVLNFEVPKGSTVISQKCRVI
ncbi:hypothetical protein [Marinomonas sp. GJ51-6]|uniref:hypothetical protein n=1 Tax=Marinomonas sp. GJ51-6 TaxID=2992802 RepID=UPI002934B0D3|nr:hypothetical protein [Marinomonas sp. GJ51-6]WOD06203.1 hypothetical protein ONZ50_10690 [Marinomonas sp. GJ51-6]